MQIRVGQHKLLREMNEMAVLSVVRLMGVASRMDVVRKTGLTKSTVSLATRSLMEQGLLEESGTFSGKRGRPGSLLTFRSQAGHLIGASIDVDEYRIVLMDLAGRPLYRISGLVNAKLAPRELLNNLAESIRGLLQHHTQHRVWGVGISIPGVVAQGSVWCAPNMGWENVPVRSVMEHILNLPVYVANNADAGAIGEYYFGQGQDSRL